MSNLTRLYLLDEPASPTRFSLHEVPRTFFDAFPSPAIPIGTRADKWCKTVQMDGHDVLLVTDQHPTPKRP